MVGSFPGLGRKRNLLHGLHPLSKNPCAGSGPKKRIGVEANKLRMEFPQFNNGVRPEDVGEDEGKREVLGEWTWCPVGLV